MKRKHRRSRGFTLTESIIICVVVGIVSIIAAPGFSNLLESIRLKEAVAEVQVSLSNAQRHAIRSQNICEASITTNHKSSSSSKFPSTIHVNCSRNARNSKDKETTFDNQIVVATNMIPLQSRLDDGSVSNSSQDANQAELDKWCRDHQDHGHEDWPELCEKPVSPSSIPKLAQIEFSPIGSMRFDINSRSDTPSEPAGKLVMYRRSKSKDNKQCLVMSRRLGLTRLGRYDGEMSQKSITDSACIAKDWTTQS